MAQKIENFCNPACKTEAPNLELPFFCRIFAPSFGYNRTTSAASA